MSIELTITLPLNSFCLLKAAEERNYHVFYQMCAAREEKELEGLALDHQDTFLYTNQVYWSIHSYMQTRYTGVYIHIYKPGILEYTFLYTNQVYWSIHSYIQTRYTGVYIHIYKFNFFILFVN